MRISKIVSDFNFIFKYNPIFIFIILNINFLILLIIINKVFIFILFLHQIFNII